MSKHVALYCRLSPRPDGTYEGVELQQRWGRTYAAKTWPGLLPVVIYADKGISAANGDKRPDYDRLRAAVERGDVAQVWCVEQSRLERREAEWFTLAALFDAAGITELHTDRDGIVRVTDEVAGIKAVLNAGEVRKLKRRVNDKLQALADDGRPHGGNTFGYAHVEVDGVKTLAIVPAQAEALRDAASKVLAGWSLSHVAADLTRRGVRGARGADITYKTLNRMLTNPTVAGKRSHRGRITQGVWEPILDEMTAQQLREKLAGPRTVATAAGGDYEIGTASYGQSPRSRRRYVLTGGIARGACGGPMGAQRRKVYGERLGAIYYCSTDYCSAVMADQLEAHVRDELFTELDRPEFLDELNADDSAGRRKAIYDALDELERKRGNLAAMWTANQLTDGEWQAARSGVAEQEQALRRDLAAIPAPLGDLDITTVRGAWPDMILDEQRALVTLFITAVHVMPAIKGARKFNPDRVRIEWRKR